MFFGSIFIARLFFFLSFFFFQIFRWISEFKIYEFELFECELNFEKLNELILRWIYFWVYEFLSYGFEMKFFQTISSKNSFLCIRLSLFICHETSKLYVLLFLIFFSFLKQIEFPLLHYFAIMIFFSYSQILFYWFFFKN